MNFPALLRKSERIDFWMKFAIGHCLDKRFRASEYSFPKNCFEFGRGFLIEPQIVSLNHQWSSQFLAPILDQPDPSARRNQLICLN